MDANISRWRGLCIAVIRGAIFCCEGKLAPDRVPHNKLVLGVGPPHRANLKRKKIKGPVYLEQGPSCPEQDLRPDPG